MRNKRHIVHKTVDGSWGARIIGSSKVMKKFDDRGAAVEYLKPMGTVGSIRVMNDDLTVDRVVEKP